MKLDFNGIIYALSYALDSVEAELVGVQTGHGKWVAYLSVLLGKGVGMEERELADLAACAVLHDNALTQYISEEKNVSKTNLPNAGKHCVLGEENIRNFPFHTDVSGAILCHHENADGSGFFHKRASEVPLMAQIIHFADMLDMVCQVQNISKETYQKMTNFIEQKRDRFFAGKIVDMFYQVMPEKAYLDLRGKEIGTLLQQALPGVTTEFSFDEVERIMEVFAKIADYKSSFTRKHSQQIALKLLQMADYYGYEKELKERLFVAGALHDIGKMAIDNDILEKPEKLTDTEFAYMQNHAWFTYVILSQVQGFEDITRWASRHHEKLNGKGYPFGLHKEDLDEKERLVACIDIYQALSEDRPYKPGMSHEKCIAIMRDMVQKGFIDGKITEDVNLVFGNKQ